MMGEESKSVEQSQAYRLSNLVSGWAFAVVLFAMLTGIADPFTSALILEMSVSESDWLTKFSLWLAGPVNFADLLRRDNLLAFVVFSVVVSFLISLIVACVVYGCAKLNEFGERQAAEARAKSAELDS